MSLASPANPPLFATDDSADACRPLADRMRPATLDEYAGQRHLLASGKPLRNAVENNRLHSMLLWGPPGTGKTTLARLTANYCSAEFITLSAVLAGVRDIRSAVDRAREVRQQDGRATILFVDEVHRFNKAQQDAFLPHIENGTIYFIGATTENPSFELNNALLSRVRTYVLKSLSDEDLAEVILHAVNDKEKGLGKLDLMLEQDALDLLVRTANGDARRALNWLEIATDLAEPDAQGEVHITASIIENVAQESMQRFDKGGDIFYEQISALHKSVRGSQPDAALYWFCRMLQGGCDPLYIARRVVRMASEDIGNADPRGLRIALDAWETYDRLGTPEGELAIAQAVLYLACAAKSNAAYMAFNAAMKDVRQPENQGDVPIHLRNAPTRFMKDLDYGREYRYAHDEEHGYAAGETWFPDDMSGQQYYFPVDRGLEKKIREKLEWLKGLDRAAGK